MISINEDFSLRSILNIPEEEQDSERWYLDNWGVDSDASNVMFYEEDPLCIEIHFETNDEPIFDGLLVILS